jgi:hypothetical protein
MPASLPALRPCFTAFGAVLEALAALSHFMVLATRSGSSLAAENLFLRKQFMIRDRDGIFSNELDKAVTAMGVRVFRIPVRSPQAKRNL